MLEQDRCGPYRTPSYGIRSEDKIGTLGPDREGKIMPKILSQEQVEKFDAQGYTDPIQVLTEEEVRRYRGHLEGFEARYPEHVKKLKSKSHLLCPWVVELAEHRRILDTFDDILGPDILCWSMAWRIKKPDGQTVAGWHQDSAYFGVEPILIFGPLALSECGPREGCLRVIPGSHRWGALPHQDSEDPNSILARGQSITAPLDTSNAVDLALKPGQMALINTKVVHCSGPNNGTDRRIMLLVEMMPTHAWYPGPQRESAMLVRGVDVHRNFDEDPRPDAEFSPRARAAWEETIGRRAKTIFRNSSLAPSEAYGGSRPAV